MRVEPSFEIEILISPVLLTDKAKLRVKKDFYYRIL
jgi:hypothetical protein